MKRITLLLLAIVLVACSPSAYDTLFQSAKDDFEQAHYKEALHQFNKAKEERATAEVTEWAYLTERILSLQTMMEDEQWKQAENALDALHNVDVQMMNEEEQTTWANTLRQFEQSLTTKQQLAHELETLTSLTEDEALQTIETIEQDETLASQLTTTQQQRLQQRKEAIQQERQQQANAKTKEEQQQQQRQSIIDDMETQVNGQAYIERAADIMLNAYYDGATSLVPYRDQLGVVFMNPILSDYEGYFANGDVCFECDMELIPGLFHGLSFLAYEDVSPGQVKVKYVTESMELDGSHHMEDDFIFTYKKDGTRWKLSHIQYVSSKPKR